MSRHTHPACWEWPITPRATIDTWHADKCAICGDRRGITVLCNDHDHVTGLRRGWLCQRCNLAEGRDDNVQLRRYRWAPPSVLLNQFSLYVNRSTGSTSTATYDILKNWDRNRRAPFFLRHAVKRTDWDTDPGNTVEMGENMMIRALWPDKADGIIAEQEAHWRLLADQRGAFVDWLESEEVAA